MNSSENKTGTDTFTSPCENYFAPTPSTCLLSTLAALRPFMKIYLLAVFCGLVQLARAGGLPVDEKLTQNAVAVLRVELIFADKKGPGDFVDYFVHTIREFKNEAHKPIGDIIVLAYKGRPGVPKGECTIYLQRYDFLKKEFSNNANIGQWILVGGDATNGVSHVKVP